MSIVDMIRQIVVRERLITVMAARCLHQATGLLSCSRFRRRDITARSVVLFRSLIDHLPYPTGGCTLQVRRSGPAHATQCSPTTPHEICSARRPMSRRDGRSTNVLRCCFRATLLSASTSPESIFHVRFVDVRSTASLASQTRSTRYGVLLLMLLPCIQAEVYQSG